MYLDRTELLPCNVGDKVYLYNKKITIDKDFEINKENMGTVLELKQEVVSDWQGINHLEFMAKIKTNDGYIITVKDPMQKLLFRKYEFLPMQELIELLDECKTNLKRIIIK